MRLLMLFLLCCVLGLAVAQYDHQYSTTTPVPILKQINRHNEDGSYSYGYENADGSYKIESKYPTGEVYGKYGFIDDSGSVREIEYGASRRGFEPAGTGINVPPSTLTGNSIADPNEPQDDGQYREDPSVYYTDPKYTNGERYEPVSKRRQQQRYQQPSAPPVAHNPPVSRYPEYRQPPSVQQPQYQSDYRQPLEAPQPQYQPEYRQLPAAPQLQYQPEYRQLPAAPQLQYQPEYRQPTGAPQPQYRPQYRTQSQPEYETQQYQQPAPIAQPRFQGHPASNIDLNAGSYTVNYKR